MAEAEDEVEATLIESAVMVHEAHEAMEEAAMRAPLAKGAGVDVDVAITMVDPHPAQACQEETWRLSVTRPETGRGK
jgi:hypothetical protein